MKFYLLGALTVFTLVGLLMAAYDKNLVMAMIFGIALTVEGFILGIEL